MADGMDHSSRDSLVSLVCKHLSSFCQDRFRLGLSTEARGFVGLKPFAPLRKSSGSKVIFCGIRVQFEEDGCITPQAWPELSVLSVEYTTEGQRPQGCDGKYLFLSICSGASNLFLISSRQWLSQVVAGIWFDIVILFRLILRSASQLLL